MEIKAVYTNSTTKITIIKSVSFSHSISLNNMEELLTQPWKPKTKKKQKKTTEKDQQENKQEST